MQRKTCIAKDNADDDNWPLLALAIEGKSLEKRSNWITATETKLGSRHQVKCVDDESNATNLPSC